MGDADKPDKLWMGSLPAELYAVAGKFTEDDDDAWTVSPDPDVPGWETDCGAAGYSIPRVVAEEICRRYNSRMFLYGETVVGYASKVLKGETGPIDTRTLIDKMRQIGYEGGGKTAYNTVYSVLYAESKDPSKPIRKQGSTWVYKS